MLLTVLTCLAFVPASGGEIRSDLVGGDVLIDTVAYTDGSAVVITMRDEGASVAFVFLAIDGSSVRHTITPLYPDLADWAVVRASGHHIHLTLNWLKYDDIEHFRYRLPAGAIAFSGDGAGRRSRIYLPAVGRSE